MFLALLAYFKVFIVSSNYEEAGEILAIITVLQFPPKESLSNRVSLLSLYGTKKPFLLLSPNALIQLAKANRDRLIFAPSLSLSPLFSVTVPLSLPARSMRLNFPFMDSISVFLVLLRYVTLIWKTAWDRDDVKLALVASVVLRLLPWRRRFITY